MNTLGAILTGIGRVIDWGLRNFLRLVLAGVIIIAGIIVVPKLFGWEFSPFKTQVQQVPAVEDARFVVHTDSRQYFTSDYEWQGDTLILRGYWTYDGDEWVYRENELPLSDAYGQRTVGER